MGTDEVATEGGGVEIPGEGVGSVSMWASDAPGGVASDWVP